MSPESLEISRFALDSQHLSQSTPAEMARPQNGGPIGHRTVWSPIGHRMESAMDGDAEFQSSTTDLSSLLTNERLNAALRDVAQLEVNKAVMLSRLGALEHTLQSSPATPSAVLMRPSLSTYSASSSTPAKGAVGDSNEVAALSGTQPHTPKTDLVALRIEPAKVAQKGETRLNTAVLIFKPPPAMVNKRFQTPA